MGKPTLYLVQGFMAYSPCPLFGGTVPRMTYYTLSIWSDGILGYTQSHTDKYLGSQLKYFRYTFSPIQIPDRLAALLGAWWILKFDA